MYMIYTSSSRTKTKGKLERPLSCCFSQIGLFRKAAGDAKEIMWFVGFPLSFGPFWWDKRVLRIFVWKPFLRRSEDIQVGVIPAISTNKTIQPSNHPWEDVKRFTWGDFCHFNQQQPFNHLTILEKMWRDLRGVISATSTNNNHSTIKPS